MFENLESSRDSFWVTGFWPYLGVVGISVWAGLVSFFSKKRKFTWASLFAHLLSSSFAGVMAYLLCIAMSIPGPMIGVACGIAGHMGTPAFIKLARRFKIVRDLMGDDEQEQK